MDYGEGPGVVRGQNGRYHQLTCAKMPSRGAKKATVHHTIHRKCEEPGCITIVSVYTKGRLCNIHANRLSVKEARKEMTKEVGTKEKARMKERRETKGRAQ